MNEEPPETFEKKVRGGYSAACRPFDSGRTPAHTRGAAGLALSSRPTAGAGVLPKTPLDVVTALRTAGHAIAVFPRAAMFELARLGHCTPFEQTVACILSIRTRDEATIPIARRLLSRASTPSAILQLSLEELSELLVGSAFREAKAKQIQQIARRAVDLNAHRLPCDAEVLRSLPGVGPKCAHLVLGVACGVSAISVDSHVHRITNRWGVVAESTPEKTMRALERIVPQEHWIHVNEYLVPFGKHICTPTSPRCTQCPVEDMCQQVGVTTHR